MPFKRGRNDRARTSKAFETRKILRLGRIARNFSGIFLFSLYVSFLLYEDGSLESFTRGIFNKAVTSTEYQ